jgi:sulfur-carrier protein
MQMRVLLFGGEARTAGADSVCVELDGPARCSSLREALGNQCPALRGVLQSARFAVNGEFARDDRQLQAGDEVALIGLVGGG